MARTSSAAKQLPVCRRTHRGVSCRKRGDHLCKQRADHVQAFFEELLFHTKGRFSRLPFILAAWQRDDIIRPLFGTVRWDPEISRYVRLYRIAWIEIARKNGKSELLAGIALYLLCADDEEGAEIYGAAKDRDQARKVFDVAKRMVELSPVLRQRLTVKAHEKRIINEKTASYYETVAADATGNLGHNPHGIVFDEVLTQPSPNLWNALRTGMGTREQPLMVAATTAGNDPASFAAKEHEYCLRVAEDPRIDATRFVYMRNTPADADPFDEANWYFANAALGDFLSIQALRDEANEAREDPTKENAFRQYRLNQWVQQKTRWMPLHVWDACGGLVVESDLHGHRCFAGLDLSSKLDLTSIAYVFPDDGMRVVWRFWVPEDVVPMLDHHTGDQASVWVRQGFLRATEGNVIDYERVHHDIAEDSRRFKVVDISHDRWMATPTVQELERRKLSCVSVGQGFGGMSEPMKELMRLAKGGELTHGGNPVARWNADSVEVKRDDAENIKPVKPDRDQSGKRIDGIVALVMAIDGWMRRGKKKTRRVAGF